jgi:hypothetical protein
MYLLKTSDIEIDSVIQHQRHAYASTPSDWEPGERVLICKNKQDCKSDEKQIHYTMRLADIRPLKPGEADRYWPANNGKLRYLFVCDDPKLIVAFNLKDVLGKEYLQYASVKTYKKISPKHERLIASHLKKEVESEPSQAFF